MRVIKCLILAISIELHDKVLISERGRIASVSILHTILIL